MMKSATTPTITALTQLARTTKRKLFISEATRRIPIRSPRVPRGGPVRQPKFFERLRANQVWIFQAGLSDPDELFGDQLGSASPDQLTRERLEKMFEEEAEKIALHCAGR